MIVSLGGSLVDGTGDDETTHKYDTTKGTTAGLSLTPDSVRVSHSAIEEYIRFYHKPCIECMFEPKHSYVIDTERSHT